MKSSLQFLMCTLVFCHIQYAFSGLSIMGRAEYSACACECRVESTSRWFHQASFNSQNRHIVNDLRIIFHVVSLEDAALRPATA